MIRGTVQKVNNRQVGGKTVYSFKLNDVWYSTWTKVPPAEGTLVEFEAEQNDKGYWNVTKAGIRVVQAEAPKSLAGVASKVNLSKDDFWNRKEDRDIEKDKRIERQSCRNSALTLVDLMIRTESLPKLPAYAKREKFLVDLVDHYTEYYLTQNYGKDQEQEQSEEKNDVEKEDPSDDSDGQWQV